MQPNQDSDIWSYICCKIKPDPFTQLGHIHRGGSAATELRGRGFEAGHAKRRRTIAHPEAQPPRRSCVLGVLLRGWAATAAHAPGGCGALLVGGGPMSKAPLGPRSAARPDWLRCYSDTGRLWLFLSAAALRSAQSQSRRSIFRSQVAGQQWLPRIAHTRSSGVAPPQHPFPLAPPHRATHGVPCWAPPAKKATKNPCAPRRRRWLAPYPYPYPHPLP